MITLIGTGHVFNLIQQLLLVFDEEQPDLICVELDKQRYDALILKQTNPEAYEKHGKNAPILYKLLARFQEGMANQYGVTAGEEMITAINYAQTHQVPLAFIDMNAQRLFTNMLRKMTFREKIRLMFSGFGGFFVSKKRVEDELKKFEDNFDIYLEEIGKKLPTVKKSLIDDRNDFMVQQLASANEQYKKIVAVVGDGHIPGLSKLLTKKSLEFKAIRLSELKNKKTSESNSSQGSFSFDYKGL